MDGLDGIAFTTTWCAGALRLGGPVLLAALGETLCERGGVVNIGIEGVILLGALASYLVTRDTGLVWLGVAAAAAGGIGAGMLLALFYVIVQTNQVVVGIVWNLLCFGIAGYVLTLALGGGVTNATPVAMFVPLDLPGLTDLPIVGPILFGQSLPLYLTLALVAVTHVVLFHTKFGLSLRAVGESPQAADAAGVPVRPMRVAAVLLSCLGAGLAGAYLVLVETGLFRDTIVRGQGFIALAIVIFGRWTPLKVAFAALVFGAADSLQLSLQMFSTTLPPQFWLALPYVITLAATSGIFGRSEQPAALLQRYRRD